MDEGMDGQTIFWNRYVIMSLLATRDDADFTLACSMTVIVLFVV